jgi:outer membrane protein TolC
VEIIRQDVRSMHAAGAADSVDVWEANLAYTSADHAVRQADIAVRGAEIRLLTRLGWSPDRAVTLVDAIPEPPQQLARLAESGVRPEVRAAEAGVGLSRAQVRQQRAG